MLSFVFMFPLLAVFSLWFLYFLLWLYCPYLYVSSSDIIILFSLFLSRAYSSRCFVSSSGFIFPVVCTLPILSLFFCFLWLYFPVAVSPLLAFITYCSCFIFWLYCSVLLLLPLALFPSSSGSFSGFILLLSFCFLFLYYFSCSCFLFLVFCLLFWFYSPC